MKAPKKEVKITYKRHECIIKKIGMDGINTLYNSKTSVYQITSKQGIPIGQPIYSLKDARLIRAWINSTDNNHYIEDIQLAQRLNQQRLKDK